MNNEKYITIKELAELKGVSTRSIRLSKSKYITREITVRGGKSFEILLSSIKPVLQEKYYSKIIPTYETKQLPAPPTFRMFANWYKTNYFDKWTLLRDGEKALKEEVIPHIKRDISKIEVGEVLVADGKRLNFQVINPFTGKPCRATLIGFLDWKSTALVGYEIMIEENTQNIASALRNAILNLGKIPKFVYLDNGRAFRSKYFVGSAKFDEIGLKGIYEKLGIKTFSK